MCDIAVEKLQNDKAGFNWCRIAAEQGHAAAQHKLGDMYRKGTGVPQNIVYAFMWWRVASQILKDGKTVLNSKKQITLTRSQEKLAKRLAHECIRKKYKGC